LIVYAGAIMVLFVFVIMLLNAGEEERSRGSKVAMGLGIPAVLVVAAILMYTSEATRNPAAHDRIPIGAMYGSPAEVGRQLFREFLLPFEVTSILILIAIMGAVLLARYHAAPPPTRALDPDQASELLEIAGGHGSARRAHERARGQREARGQEVAR
ncbi:MAG TPA: NADH-quinone oxidoreductase subunit J, partial [Terriglobales bacterium]|nr:NADH-quinone oxidoreductase subunit J [Terriglobales bacterium]